MVTYNNRKIGTALKESLEMILSKYKNQEVNNATKDKIAKDFIKFLKDNELYDEFIKRYKR